MTGLDTRTYPVVGMTCDHCALAVREDVSGLAGVNAVAVELTGGRVTVTGTDLDDGAVRAGDARGQVDRRANQSPLRSTAVPV